MSASRGGCELHIAMLVCKQPPAHVSQLIWMPPVMTWLQVHWDHLMEEMAWMGKEFARSAACRTFHSCACVMQP